MATIALVGVGTMGLPMGRNLLAAGHEIIACDTDVARARALSAETTVTAAEAAARAEIVITSLPSVAAVEAAVLGAGGVAEGATSGSLLIEMSTSAPALARRLASELAARGVDVLDAPVSGGPTGAADASLTIMVGGDAPAFERARPVLSALGHLVVHVGGHGAGQATKLCNNLMAGCNMAAIAEAWAIAQAEGLEPAMFYEIVTASTGDSRVLRTRFPVAGVDERHPANREFEPMFSVDLMTKDLELVREVARAAGVGSTAVDAALERYHEAQQAGLGGLDYSAISKV